ncbi:AtpZ/AtpI family protein [bacterium]|nr:AtpZ/AtpI family protein [bacterium]
MGEIEKDIHKPAWWQPGLIMFVRLSVWIGVPVVGASFLGQWLDRQYNTEPWMFIGTVGVAFVISMVGLVVETTKEYKKIEKQNDTKKQENNSK